MNTTGILLLGPPPVVQPLPPPPPPLPLSVAVVEPSALSVASVDSLPVVASAASGLHVVMWRRPPCPSCQRRPPCPSCQRRPPCPSCQRHRPCGTGSPQCLRHLWYPRYGRIATVRRSGGLLSKSAELVTRMGRLFGLPGVQAQSGS